MLTHCLGLGSGTPGIDEILFCNCVPQLGCTMAKHHTSWPWEMATSATPPGYIAWPSRRPKAEHPLSTNAQAACTRSHLICCCGPVAQCGAMTTLQDRFNINSQLEHLQTKYVGTGVLIEIARSIREEFVGAQTRSGALQTRGPWPAECFRSAVFQHLPDAKPLSVMVLNVFLSMSTRCTCTPGSRSKRQHMFLLAADGQAFVACVRLLSASL